MPVVTSRIEGRLYAVVSVNAFEGEARSALNVSSASFDGEDRQSRLSTRARNWIPSVEFVERPA